MATYTVAAGTVGAHAKTLTANTEDTVEFDENISAARVLVLAAASGSTAPIYITGDGTAATVAGARTHALPAVAGAEAVIELDPGVDDIHLISAGAHTYSVEKA
jgi:hypothetical protein